ncbi:Ig-like domain-containing protein, partial [Patescibacteria group bacterium]|nr:Ig-like domain-containing protein [Patescibacteria group bacterium]
IGVNANLVIGFSKAVSAGTGNVTIYKVSDDSVVEAIDVSSEKVTGGGTTSITLNPDATLDEGTEYYILIPSTAFKDASENIFDGISDESTWAFTTEDVTAPVLSAVTITDLATTTATVTWTSGEAGSSKVVYSTGSSYASTTSETNTSSRVTSHSKGLTGLTRCTTYNYKAVSGDSFANYATSTSALFTTLGCVGNSAPAAATTTTVTVSGTATSTLTQSGRTLTVSTPENFTATSSTVVIQIRSQEATGVLDAVGMPGSLSTAASIVFDVTAIVDDEVELDSFDAPVTITYEYTDTDIDGIDESTLSMYHYHDDAWFELDDCSLDMAGNSITCTTPNFSIFGIFGSPPVTAGGSSSIKRGTSIQGQVRNLISLGKVAEAAVLKAAWPHLFAESAVAATSVPVSTNITMVRDLEYLMTGDDVRQLQVLLNANKYALTSSGVGSGGNETDYFGTLTRTALSRYQTANGITPAVGYFGPLTRAQMKSVGIGWW